MDPAAFVHFARRLRERFGVHLRMNQVEEMEDYIRRGYYAKICDQDHGVTLYRVPFGKRMAAVAYNNENRTVVTAMPVEWATSQSYKLERAKALAEAATVVEEVKDDADDS